tara:strand:- start:2178 stop:4331 length:2154 start_codon:yes stop_codon:yes gene_type:complete
MAEVKEYSLKIDTKTAQANIDELNQSLELQEDLINDIEKELSGYQKQLEKTSKKDLAARKSLNDKIKKTKSNLNEEKQGLKDVKIARDKSNKALKEAEQNTADFGGVLGMVDSKTGGLISGLQGMTKSIGGATKGFNLMKVAIIGTGIGALLLGILAVSKAFTSSEEGQNKFAKIMAVIGSVTGNLVTMLSDLGMMIIGVFENPKQAIIDLKDLIVENITNRITSLIDTLGFLGSAIKKVFSGDFSGALDDAKNAGNSYVDSLTGVKNTIDKVSGSVSNLTNELIKEGKIAAGIADQRAKADKLDRKLTIQRAEANRKRAELLDKAAQKESFTSKERIAFLTEAGQIEDEITKKEIQAAKLRLNAKVAENALANSTKEDLQEEANLKANLINLETARLSKQKAVSAQIVGAKREEAAEIKAINDQAKADKEAAEADEIAKAKELAALKKQIRDAEAISEQDKRDLELVKIQEQFDALILQAQENNLVTDELKLARDVALKEKQDEFDEADLERKKKIADEDAKLEEQKRQQQQKTLDNLISIGGAESKFGKAMLVAKQLLLAKEMIMEIKATLFSAKQSATKTVVKSAEAGVDVASGAAKAASAAPFPANIPLIIGYAAQAVGIVSAIKGAMKASKQATSKVGATSSSSSISTPSSGAGSAPAAPPAFNVVGASDTNQLAEAIGGQSQQPIQTYVVASDVSTAQELDRNIVTGATIG